MSNLFQDIRYSFRTLAQKPGFTAIAVLTLALGIGAATTMFSVVDTVLLRPLPFPSQNQLLHANGKFAKSDDAGVSPPDFADYRANARTLQQFAAIGYLTGVVNITGGDQPVQVQSQIVSWNFFQALGIPPLLGRDFIADDEKQFEPAVAILGNGIWKRDFGADPGIIGRKVTIDGQSITIVGVLSADVPSISHSEVWMPLPMENPGMNVRQAHFLAVIARMKPGVDVNQARAELDTIAGNIAAQHPDTNKTWSLRVMPLSAFIVGDTRKALLLLLGAVILLLLIGCANVANLLLARATSRRKEIAIRSALGAGRWRIARQMLTESLILSIAGGAFGIFSAVWSVAGLAALAPSTLPRINEIQVNWTVLAFAVGISLVTGILFGLAPALRGTHVDPGPAMKEGARNATQSSRLLDRLLVIAQVALSVVLMIGAGLFVRTLQHLWSVNMGYERDNVLMFSVDAKLAGYPPDRAATVYREILQRLQVLPDVRSASASIVRPVDDQFYLIDRIEEVDGCQLADRDAINVAWNAMSPGYFSTVATPILLGRDFDPRDKEIAPPVVIVNESLARRAFPGQNPIGHRLGPATVVGVVKDALYGGAREQPRPVLYHPLFQHGRDQEYRWGFVSFELRYRSAANLLDQARREIASVDRNLPVFLAKTLRQQSAQSLLRERLLATVSSFFGGLALLLACLGLYGLMAYAVARRAGEIGIRMALGARRDHILWLVLRETLWLTLAGIAAGLPLALWAARYTKSLLFGIESADPLTIASTITLLIGVAAFAGYVPARRALRVDPMASLRCE